MPSRRQFLRQSIAASAAGGLGAAVGFSESDASQEATASPPRGTGRQRRWRTAFGLNGFMSSEHLIAIVDGVSHPQVKGMYDPSHFDLMNGGKGKPEELLLRFGVHRLGYIHLTDTDGTMFGGTSRHLPCGDGHVDIPKSLEILWNGGFDGWIMIDPWKTKDPYDACRKGRVAIETARRTLSRR